MKAWRRCAVLAAAFSLCLLGSAQEVKQIYSFKGGVKINPGVDITKKELAVVSQPGRFFTQSWTFVYYTDDGAGGYIQFSIMRLYTLKQIAAHHTHFTPEGKMIYRKEILSPKDLKWDEKEPRLMFGSSGWSGYYPEFRVTVPLEGLETYLTFNCETPPWRPGQGPVHYGSPDGDWYDLIVFIPLARISGTIRVEGKERRVTGWGYADHNTQTVWFNTQVEHLYALRSFSGQAANAWAVQFLDYHSPAEFGNQRVSWIVVIKDGKMVYATDRFELQASNWSKEPRRGREYPQEVRVSVKDPEFKLEGVIRGIRLLDVLDVRDQVPGWLEPLASRLIKQPAFIRQKAEFNWKINYQGREETVPVNGILEYTIVEKE